MVYSKEVTSDHPLSKQFALSLNEMVTTDGGEGLFPDEAIAISLDNAEHSRRGSSPVKTMDSAIGIAARQTFPELRNKRMVMCEFRFNYKNWKNIRSTELEEKIDQSRSLLQENYTGKIDPKCFFLFDERIVEQVRNLFFRIYPSKKNDRIVKTEKEFKQLIF